MYVFTRTAHLTPGDPTEGITWASEVCHKVRDLTNHPLQLWSSMYSPDVGTLVWSAWFEDLPMLERVSDKLQTDGGYQQMLQSAKELFQGSVDDALMEPLHGAPGREQAMHPDRSTQYATTVRAVAAAGSIERSITKGIEIAQHVERTTGHATTFMRGLSGSYGAVSWVTGFESIGALQVADSALAADAGWMRLLDDATTSYVDAPMISQQQIFRRLT